MVILTPTQPQQLQSWYKFENLATSIAPLHYWIIHPGLLSGGF
jgi:hypothetical protein